MSEGLITLNAFHFLRPLWLLALPVLVAIIIATYYRHPPGGAWQRVIAPQLQPLLLSSTALSPRWPTRALLIGAVLASLALAGPTWERTSVTTSRLDGALVILFDLSPSMLASDIRPDRLTRARLKTIDLLKRQREGTVALVAWAEEAYVVTPLTDDTNTVLAMLPVLQPDILPGAGSNPELALEKGLELLMNTGHREGDLLFVTDGFVSQAAENIQHRLRQFPEFRLSILGVGSDEGAPIPLPEGGFARDRHGGIVVAKLGSTLLQQLAERNGGRYRTLGADDSDIEYLLQPLLAHSSGQLQEQQRSLETWLDRGPWLTLLLLPLAILAFRRNVFALLLLAPLLHPGSARASEVSDYWQALWKNREQQAYYALQAQQPERAAELFSDPQWQAAARYRSGDYAAASEGFSADHSAVGHYNRGNALAHQGRLEEAIAAYDQALALDDELSDAHFNRQLLQQLLDNPSSAPSDRDHTTEPSGADDDGGSPLSDRSDNDPAQGQDQSQALSNTDPVTGNTPESAPSGEDDSNGSTAAHSDTSAADGAAGSTAAPAQPFSRDNAPLSSAEDTADSPLSGNHPPSDERNSPASAPSAPSKADPLAPAETSDDESQPSATTHNTTAAASGDDDSARDNRELEYWLRRVPDDPGGLLRRKFHYQSQQMREPRQRFELPPDRFQEERW